MTGFGVLPIVRRNDGSMACRSPPTDTTQILTGAGSVPDQPSSPNDPNDKPRASNNSADLDETRAQLEALEKELKTRRPEPEAEEGGQSEEVRAGYAKAMRLSSDFIAGVAVGGGLGYGLDTVAGTSPWGLIVLLLLGFAAGVLNMMRTLGMVAPSKFDRPQASERGQTRQDDAGPDGPSGG